jgi:hypothetical protein
MSSDDRIKCEKSIETAEAACTRLLGEMCTMTRPAYKYGLGDRFVCSTNKSNDCSFSISRAQALFENSYACKVVERDCPQVLKGLPTAPPSTTAK